MQKNKGFTLIELLVVIAIIGILASVVLTSLNSARKKGGDAAIKANLSNIRVQAELYYDDGATYAGTARPETTCRDNLTNNIFADTNIKSAIAQANKAAGGTLSNHVYSFTRCAANATSWAVAVTMRGDNNKSWCVDSSGNSLQVIGPAQGRSRAILGNGTTSLYTCGAAA